MPTLSAAVNLARDATGQIEAGLEDTSRPERSVLRSYFKCLGGSLALGLALSGSFTSPDNHITTATLLISTTIILSLLWPIFLTFDLDWLGRIKVVTWSSYVAIMGTGIASVGFGILLIEARKGGCGGGSSRGGSVELLTGYGEILLYVVGSLGAMVGAFVFPFVDQEDEPEEKRGWRHTLKVFDWRQAGVTKPDDRYEIGKSSLQGYFAILAGFQATVGTSSIKSLLKYNSTHSCLLTINTAKFHPHPFAWSASLSFTSLLISLSAQLLLANLTGSFSTRRRHFLITYSFLSISLGLISLVIHTYNEQTQGGVGSGDAWLLWMNTGLGWAAANFPLGVFIVGERVVEGWKKVARGWGRRIKLRGRGGVGWEGEVM